MKEYTVNVSWDDGPSVWCAVCNELQITSKSVSFDAVIERIKTSIQERLKKEGAETDCVLAFTAERRGSVSNWQTQLCRESGPGYVLRNLFSRRK